MSTLDGLASWLVVVFFHHDFYLTTVHLEPISVTVLFFDSIPLRMQKYKLLHFPLNISTKTKAFLNDNKLYWWYYMRVLPYKRWSACIRHKWGKSCSRLEEKKHLKAAAGSPVNQLNNLKHIQRGLKKNFPCTNLLLLFTFKHAAEIELKGVCAMNACMCGVVSKTQNQRPAA